MRCEKFIALNYLYLTASIACLVVLLAAIPAQAEQKPDFRQLADPGLLQAWQKRALESYPEALKELETLAAAGNLVSALESDAEARMALRGALTKYISINSGEPPPDVFYDDAIPVLFGDDRWIETHADLLLLAQRYPEYKDWLGARLFELYRGRGQQAYSSGLLMWVASGTLGNYEYAVDAKTADDRRETADDLKAKLKPEIAKRLAEGKVKTQGIPRLAPIFYFLYAEEPVASYEEMYEILRSLGEHFDTTYLILELEFVFNAAPSAVGE